MKAIKITNLTDKAGALLNKLREDELNSAKKLRIVSIITATVGSYSTFIVALLPLRLVILPAGTIEVSEE